MKKLSVLLALLLVFCQLSACSSFDRIRFGTAGEGGNYNLFGKAFAGHLAEDTDLKIEVKSTAGSAANLRLMSENYLQVAIAQNDMIDEALKKGMSGFQAIASLYTEYCQIIVRDDSAISKISDLRGKSVSVGEEESGTERNAQQILSAYGISDKLLNKKNLTYAQAAEALEVGEIDAMFVTAGIQTEIVESLAGKTAIRLLPIEGEALSILMDSYDFYEKCVITAGTYSGQDEDVQTIGVESVLLASETVSEEVVYKITKELYDHTSEIQSELPFTLEPALKGITLSLHSGAKKYYLEAGIEIPAGM